MAPTSWLQEPDTPLPPSGLQEICACYFETHVSPMLKIIQNSQELMNKKLEDNYTTVQKASDALGVEQRLLKFEFGELLSKSPEGHKVSTLMQELTAKVHEKADASDVARLSALVEGKVGLSSKGSIKGPQVSPQVTSPSQMQCQDRVDACRLLQECMARFDKQDAALAKKADSEHVATLVQLQEMRKELLAVMAEHKVEGSTACNNLEADKVEAKEEQVEPTRQGVSKPCLSKILKSKLTNAEEDNERLQVKLDAAMNKLESVSAAKAVDVEAHVAAVSGAAMSQPLEPTRPLQDEALQLVELTNTEDDNESLLLDKHSDEQPLDFELTLSSDGSTEDSTQDSTQEPCASKCCTQEVHCDTEALLQQESVALNVERVQMQQAEQEARCVSVEVCIIAQEECDRLRDKFKEPQTAWHLDRSCLTAQHSEELQQDAIERDASPRTVLAEKGKALQQVEPTGQDSSRRSLSKILKLKLTNAEEENERLQQESEALSRKFEALRSMSDTTVEI